MIWLIFFLGCVIGATIGIVICVVIDKNNDDGYLYIYPDEKGRMCTVASFDPKTVALLRYGINYNLYYNKVVLHVIYLDMNTRKNISPYNEESSTTVL